MRVTAVCLNLMNVRMMLCMRARARVHACHTKDLLGPSFAARICMHKHSDSNNNKNACCMSNILLLHLVCRCVLKCDRG